MRIVFALPAYHAGPIGGYIVHYQYADLLARLGHEVTVLFPRQADGTVSGLEGLLWAAYVRLRNRPLVRWLPSDTTVKLRLVRDLSPRVLPDADVLIATAWQTALPLAAAPRRCGRKFYIVYDYEHLMTAGMAERQLIESTYALPFGIVATSGVVADTVRRCGGTPLAVVPCGLDFSAFGMDVAPEQREPFTVGFPMRSEPFKGAADAIEAAAILRTRYGERLRVTAFGSRRLGLPEWIEWLDYPSQPALRRFYNAQSVFLLPSHFEGWGLPGVEAMACGAAVVTADNGGCRDYAFDGETASVVLPRQPQGLADAVGRLFEDDGLRIRLARAGERFVQRFQWRDAAERLNAVLSTEETHPA